MGDVIQLHLNTDPAISLDEYRLLKQIQALRAQLDREQQARTRTEIQAAAVTDAALDHMLFLWSTNTEIPPTDAEYEAKRADLRALLMRAAHNAVRKDQTR